jgi:hypothetical protein
VDECLLVCVRGERCLPRGKGVADELVRPEKRLGFAEVVRELGRVLIGVVPVEGLERLGDARVEANSSREREFLRQGLLDQGVGELVAAQVEERSRR